MGIGELAKVGALLARLSRPATERPDRRVIEDEDRRDWGMLHDVYEPRGGTTTTVVALHGATLNGKDHPQLRHFARCLAASGVACVLPTLEGLADMRFTGDDVAALAGLVAGMGRQGRRVGLVGFSFGGSYALLAAASPLAAEHVRFVLTFGAYCSLTEVVDRYQAALAGGPRGGAAWDDHLYLHLMEAHRHRDRLGLGEGAQAELVALLRRYCHDATAEEKQRFFDRHLAETDVLSLDGPAERAATSVVSPSGKLAGLRCPVSLVHDPKDNLVPVEQAARLYAELRALPGGDQHHLLVTTLLDHAALSDVMNVREVVRLLRVLAPLVRA